MKTIPIATRKSKVNYSTLGTPSNPWGVSAAQFVANLPRGPMVVALEDLSRAVRLARKSGLPVALFLGGHPIKVGLGPFIVNLINQGIVTALVVNGSVFVHDYEMAVHGETSEDVAAALKNGTFGVTQETQEFMLASVAATTANRLGMGESIASQLVEALRLRNQSVDKSILATAREKGIPISAHVALGADVPHMAPQMEWGVWGIKLERDFLKTRSIVSTLSPDGVAIFLGSCTLLPEVFLKAVALNRNENGGCTGFVTGVFDLFKQYRLEENVIRRPTDEGYYILGPSEINFPIFCAMVKM